MAAATMPCRQAASDHQAAGDCCGGEANAAVHAASVRVCRVTPLVAHLQPEALLWLSSQDFMEDCAAAVAPAALEAW